MTTKQPEALRLADVFDDEIKWQTTPIFRTEVAAELRRLHEVNAELQAKLAQQGEQQPVAWRAWLLRMEWSDWHFDLFGDSPAHCPDCGNQREDGHEQGCELAAMLAAAPAAQPDARKVIEQMVEALGSMITVTAHLGPCPGTVDEAQAAIQAGQQWLKENK